MDVTGKRDSYRYTYIDVVKGIAIIGVYFGHHSVFPSVLTDWFWSFHMPLFFFITGLFSKRLITQSIHETIKTGLTKLVLPFVLTEFILTIALLVMLHQTTILLSPIDFLNCLYKALIIDNHPIWFLLALFYGRIIINAILSLTKSPHNQASAECLIIIILLFCVGWGIGHYLIKQGLTDYACICKGLLAPIYIYIGILLRQFVLQQTSSLFILSCSIILLSFAYKVPFNMYYFDYPLGIFNVLLSIIICISLLYTLRILCNSHIKGAFIVVSILEFIGRNTLYILCAHTLELILKIHRFIPTNNIGIAHLVIFIIILLSIPIIKRIPIIRTIYQLN